MCCPSCCLHKPLRHCIARAACPKHAHIWEYCARLVQQLIVIQHYDYVVEGTERRNQGLPYYSAHDMFLVEPQLTSRIQGSVISMVVVTLA